MATAVPAVTSESHTVEDVGWYGSGTFVPAASYSCRKTDTNLSLPSDYRVRTTPRGKSLHNIQYQMGLPDIAVDL